MSSAISSEVAATRIPISPLPADADDGNALAASPLTCALTCGTDGSAPQPLSLVRDPRLRSSFSLPAPPAGAGHYALPKPAGASISCAGGPFLFAAFDLVSNARNCEVYVTDPPGALGGGAGEKYLRTVRGTRDAGGNAAGDAGGGAADFYRALYVADAPAPADSVRLKFLGVGGRGGSGASPPEARVKSLCLRGRLLPEGGGEPAAPASASSPPHPRPRSSPTPPTGAGIFVPDRESAPTKEDISNAVLALSASASAADGRLRPILLRIESKLDGVAAELRRRSARTPPDPGGGVSPAGADATPGGSLMEAALFRRIDSVEKITKKTSENVSDLGKILTSYVSHDRPGQDGAAGGGRPPLSGEMGGRRDPVAAAVAAAAVGEGTPEPEPEPTERGPPRDLPVADTSAFHRPEKTGAADVGGGGDADGAAPAPAPGPPPGPGAPAECPSSAEDESGGNGDAASPPPTDAVTSPVGPASDDNGTRGPSPRSAELEGYRCIVAEQRALIEAQREMMERQHDRLEDVLALLWGAGPRTAGPDNPQEIESGGDNCPARAIEGGGIDGCPSEAEEVAEGILLEFDTKCEGTEHVGEDPPDVSEEHDPSVLEGTDQCPLEGGGG